jgi:uncharacterized protein (DUF302 family)
MSQNNKNQKYRTILISSAIGIFIGFILCGIIIYSVMPSMMIVTKQSSMSFDDTINTLKKQVTQNGWVVSGVSDVNKSLSAKGVQLQPRVKLFNLCKPEYAKSILTTDRYVSTMMPCTFGVWENDKGDVFISKMNMKLMAKMFGGNIAAVMGDKVAKDEENILKGVLID